MTAVVSTPTGVAPGTRIALYSHDAVGLGHTRRNLAIAQELATALPEPAILVLSGAPEVSLFDRPVGCDVVGLPALTKDARSRYAARTLPVGHDTLRDLRSDVLAAALARFSPDLLIVDKHPLGVDAELEPALRHLATHARTGVVLGLRDVLDDPQTAAAEWRACAGPAALRRYYDAVWVYGDPVVHDPVAALDLPADLTSTLRYTGYLGQRRTTRWTDGHPLDGRDYVLGLCGAGGDGAQLADAFRAHRPPDGLHGVFIAGPHLPADARDRLHATAADRADLTVLDFVADLAPWLDHASAVVSMGGYNTVCETAVRSVPHLVVPRVQPRTEQLIRARALHVAGVLDVLEPDELSAAALSSWTAVALRTTGTEHDVAFDGLDRVSVYATELLTGRDTYRAAC